MNVVVPQDFLQYVVKAMKQLKMANRTNFLYALAKGLGTQRSDGKDSVFPSKQLVAGMVEHCVNFFNAKFVDEVRSCSSIWSLFICTVTFILVSVYQLLILFLLCTCR